MPSVGVSVFLKAPLLGTVKTRLARDVGVERALRLYRQMGIGAVNAARASGMAVTVWYEPEDCRQLMVDWLGPDLLFRVQAPGDLGARMAAVPVNRGAILIGGDCPGLTAAHLITAAQALDRFPVVLGPSEDGGYYLLGLRTQRPDLFHDMPWSTPRVAEDTRRRLTATGSAWLELETLRDVDTAADAEAAGLLATEVGR